MRSLGLGLDAHVEGVDEETAFFREGQEWSIAQVFRHVTFDLAYRTARLDALSRGRTHPARQVSNAETATVGTLSFAAIVERYVNVRERLAGRLLDGPFEADTVEREAAAVVAHESEHAGQVLDLLARASRRGGDSPIR